MVVNEMLDNRISAAILTNCFIPSPVLGITIGGNSDTTADPAADGSEDGPGTGSAVEFVAASPLDDEPFVTTSDLTDDAGCCSAGATGFSVVVCFPSPAEAISGTTSVSVMMAMTGMRME